MARAGANEQPEDPGYIRMRTGRGTWMYAPDAKYGLRQVGPDQRFTNGNTGPIENAAANAVQPIADDGPRRAHHRHRLRSQSTNGRT